MKQSVEQNLKLFRELITCTHNLYFWTYDTSFSLIYTNCPESRFLSPLFLSVASKIPGDSGAPILLFSGLGYFWVVNPEQDEHGTPLHYHVIGPVLTCKVMTEKIKLAIFAKHTVSFPLNEAIDVLLHKIPMIPISKFLEYGLMLHYCITEEKLSINDFIYSETIKRSDITSMPGHTAAPHYTWQREQKLFRLISEGNLNYKQEMTHIVSSAAPADLGGGDILRHYKNLNISLLTLCTRAAIFGGLSPETAYFLSDKYILKLESCNTFEEISEVNQKMVEDFVSRVHAIKESKLSPQIQQCCEYIQLHIEDPLNLQTLSTAVNYSPTWLSHKFSTETGKTILQYIAEQKILRAKELLISEYVPVQEIADRLSFKSQSHFGEVFRRHTGMTPGEYRACRAKFLQASDLPPSLTDSWH